MVIWLIFEGTKRLFNIPSYKIKVTHDGETIEDEFIFGMVTNSRSVGGFKRITGENVIFDDGVFEVTLFKTPKNPVELNELIGAVVMRQINSDRIYSFKSGEVLFESVEAIPWTLDGEYGGTHEEVVIKNKNQALQIMVKEVILGVSEGAGKYMTGYKTVVGMVNGMMEELGITVPVALHLDHGSYDGCLKCVEAGFSSIMFDGSHYPIDENVEKTKELVKIAHEHGMSIEAEVGSIGGEEDGVIGRGECADPEECKRVADLELTSLQQVSVTFMENTRLTGRD